MNPSAPKMSLNAAYGLFPIVAGADKFTQLLCRWDKYLSPLARRFLPVRASTFMKVVGVVEMAVGAAMFIPRFRRYAALAASGWLSCIAVNLIANRDYDIAARDVWLAAGAASFALMLGKETSLKPGVARELPREAEGVPVLESRPDAVELRH